MQGYSSFEALFQAFEQLKVLVIGDVMIDSYAWGKVNRISPEAPVPILQVEKQEYRLGGAANVALNLKALGAKPIIAAIIGNDIDGMRFEELCKVEAIDTRGVMKCHDRPTTNKMRMISGAHHMLRLDVETTEELPAIDEAALWQKIEALLPEVNAVVFEDYDKGCVTEGLIGMVVERCKSLGIPTVVDPKFRNFSYYQGVSLFKPNLKELKEGLKVSVDPTNPIDLKHAAEQLHNRLGIEQVLITLSEHGMYLWAKGIDFKSHAHLRKIADVSGAGDTVVSVAACCLALGLSGALTLELSNLAGGLVCEYVGVVPIDKSKLLIEAKQHLSRFVA